MSRKKKIEWLKRFREWQGTLHHADPTKERSYSKGRRNRMAMTMRDIKNTDNKFYQQFKHKKNDQ